MKAPLIAIARHRLTVDGDGVTTLVAFHGCPLRCRYCLNRQCWEPKGIWRWTTPEELVNELMKDNLYFLATGGGVCFGGGEPLLRSDFIARFCQLCPKEWNIYLESSLCVEQSHLQTVIPFVKHYYIDVKDMQPDIYRQYTGGDSTQVTSNLQYLADKGLQECVTLRLPNIPAYNTPADRQHSQQVLKRMGYKAFDFFDYVLGVARTLLLLLLMVMPASVVADTTADSLRRVVDTATGSDKSKAYDQLFKHLCTEGNSSQIMALIDEWISYEHSRGDISREGLIRWSKIAVLNNFDMNEALLTEAPVQMKWFEQHSQWENYYNAWDCKGGAYFYTGRVQTALHEARLMLEDAQRRNNNYGRVVSYQLSGIIYDNMSQSEQAVTNLQKAIDLIKTPPTKSDIRFSVYDYLTQALSSNGEFQRELTVTGQWQQAIDEVRRQPGNSATVLQGSELSCKVQRIDALMGLGRLDEADQVLSEAVAMQQQVDLPVTNYRVMLIRSRLLMKQEQPAAALELLDSIKQTWADMGGSVDMLRANAMMELGRYAEAAAIYQYEYNELDSVFNRDMRSQLDELTTLYKLDETKMRDAMERERQRNLYTIIIIGIVCAALLIFIVYRYIVARRLARTNRRLEQANEQLRLANQRAEDLLKVKSDFIKSISHEIRTPLNILAGFTQVITSPDADLSEVQLADIHKRINENTDRIVKLVNKMLELTESNTHETIEREDNVAVSDIVADVIHATRISSTDKVVFEWDASSPLAATILLTNRKYAARALSCLVENAQKFTAKGLISLSLSQSSQFLNVIVEDTGIGIPSDQADRIFDEFVQIDNYTDGAGIGLTVARSIARRLGGDVHLDTSYTAGARFVMSLPLNTE